MDLFRLKTSLLEGALSKVVIIISHSSKVYHGTPNQTKGRATGQPNQCVRSCIRETSKPGHGNIYNSQLRGNSHPQKDCLRPTCSRSGNPRPAQLNLRLEEPQGDKLPQAGKLQFFLQKWQEIMREGWIVDAIQGYILLESPPIRLPNSCQFLHYYNNRLFKLIKIHPC